jgi:YidC/Oxa1 family membrane protein insertase
VGQFIDAIVNGLASVIKFFAAIGGGNTAIGIILFTIAIRLLLLPLTLKSVRSSRAMQQLQPYIKEINDRYKTKAGERLAPEKAQKKQAEIMALYSEYSVNPAAGCLPIIIQIPIFFAVYAAVTRSIGTTDPAVQFIQHAWGVFAPGSIAAADAAQLANQGLFWFHDLTKPDPYYILPVMMVVFQFLTQRMTIPKGGGADEQQKKMNKIMQYMPLIFGFTALNFPTGPVVYWVTTSIFSAVQQYFITGFGSLTDVPGLGFLPVKELPKITLKKRDPNDKPAKPGLMQRLAETQSRVQAESTAKRSEGAADASGDKLDTETVVDEAPVTNNFGRKSSVNAASKNGGVLKNPEQSGRLTETRAAKQEDAIRQAYQNLNRRPPKKTGGAGTGSSGSSGSSNAANLNQTKSGSATNLNQTKGTRKK